MARKGLTGQLNMFDLFKSLDDFPMGEVQMVSLMPEPEEEPKLIEEPKPVEEERTIEAPKQVVKAEPVEEVKSIEEIQEPVKKTRKQRAQKSAEKLPETEAQEIENSEIESQEKENQEAEIQEPEEKPVRKRLVQTDFSKERPVMCRSYEIDGKKLEIAYINYNKVRIIKTGEEPEIYEFASSKEAVDYYVQKMQELEPEE